MAGEFQTGYGSIGEMSAVFSPWPPRFSLPGRSRNLGKSVMEDPIRRARAFFGRTNLKVHGHGLGFKV